MNEFTDVAYSQIRNQLGSYKPITVPVAVDVVFFTDDRPDMDNLLCGLLDCLQDCGVLKNDRLVRRVNMRREKTRPSEARTAINIGELERT